MRNLTSIFLLSLAFIIHHPDAFAQGGVLDQSFGTGGKILTSYGSKSFGVFSLATQNDGKIVGVGASIFPNNKYGSTILRYNTNGILDTTFGSGGINAPTMQYYYYDDEAKAVIIQPNGKILIGGSTRYFPGDWDFMIIRLNSNGTIDNTFAFSGSLSYGIGHNEIATCMALQPDGKIIIGGTSLNGSRSILLLRFNSNGTIDNTFGTSGQMILPMSNGTDNVLTCIRIQTDGKILLGGYSNQKAILARLLADGSLDNSFGNGGKYISGLSTQNDYILDITIRPDGKIIAVGQSSGNITNDDILILQFTTNGALDNTFGLGGIVHGSFGFFYQQAYTLSLQSDGKILIGGNIGTNNWDFVLLRYLANGELDSLFGTNGKVMTDFANGKDKSMAMAIQTDGKIILGGISDDNFALARYFSTYATDAGLSNLIVPNNACGPIGNNETVLVDVTNTGTNTLIASSVSVNLTISGANAGSYNTSILAPITRNASTTLKFDSIILKNQGFNKFEVTLLLNGDMNYNNNSLSNYDSAFALNPIVSFTSKNISGTFTFTPGVIGKAPISYTWDFGDGSPRSNISSPIHNYLVKGIYKVKLIATDACGIDSSEKNINTLIGINEPESNVAFSFYPNPANTTVTINYPSSNQSKKVEFIDLAGNVILQTQTTNAIQSVIDITLLEDGMYLLKIDQYVKKVCVKHLN